MSEYGDSANITGSLIVDGDSDIGSGDDDIDMDAGTLFIDAAQDRVGIGTESPDYKLDVAGDIGVDQYIYHNGDADTWIRFNDDDITFKAGNLTFLDIEKKGSAPHEITINDGSNNIDFVVKGNGSGEGNPGMKFDASTNRLGINGVGTPDEALHVDGNLKVVGDDPRIKIDGDTNSHPGLELYENGTRKWIIYNNYTNDDLTFKNDSTVHMVIEDQGNVGIGTNNAGYKLDVYADAHATFAVNIHNDGDDQYRKGLRIQAGSDDGTCYRGIRFDDGNGDEVGYISWSGGTVTYATFTGAHEASVVSSDYTPGEAAYAYGTIVKIVSTSSDREKQVEYVIEPTSTAEDKAVIGVYSQNMDPDEVDQVNSHQVFALGDGHVLVCNEGGDIEIGDYICSSNAAGHGKKQSDDLLHNYTVAKATEAVTWSGESATTKLISCTYHAS